MVTVDYWIQAIHLDGDSRAALLAEAVREEVRAIGLHRLVDVLITPTPLGDAPTVAVFFGGADAAVDLTLVAAAIEAVEGLRTIVPVVNDLESYGELVPSALLRINGFSWSGTDPARRLARRLLEELGIEIQQRRVFISHKREDGCLAAENVADYLSHSGFDPFIDRFNVPTGVDFQERIANELEDYAFLLVLETPLASESKWVFDEVNYALSRFMGLHIVRWPGDFDSIPAAFCLPRQQLTHDDLEDSNGYDVLTSEALDSVLEEVEAAHAYSMVRRHRYLLRSAEDAAESAGCTCTPLGGWRLLADKGLASDVVQVTGRLPTPGELHSLDVSRLVSSADAGVLVHGARRIEKERADLLDWVVADRPLALVPEHDIGGILVGMVTPRATTRTRPTLAQRAVFLSASIPDPARWDGRFEPIEVTDAVVAAAREVIGAGGKLVMAAHPTIAPLVLYVAADFAAAEDPPVTVFQSDLFVDVLPEATRRFEADGVGVLEWTPRQDGDEPEPGKWDASLGVMRRMMLASADPVGAIFIGGMTGIDDEYRLFGEMYPERPRYPVGRPGGEARRLSLASASQVEGLVDEDVYPALFRRVVTDMIDQIPS